MYKIHINRPAGTLSAELTIYTPKSDGSIGANLVFDVDGHCNARRFEWADLDRGAQGFLKPAIIMEENEVRDLILAFQELGKSLGIEVDSESKAKGKLDAMEYHLEDLRHLLKLDVPINIGVPIKKS